MVKTVYCLYFTLLSFSVLSQTPKIKTLKQGSWSGNLTLSSTNNLHFQIELKKVKKEYVFTLINGEERIEMIHPRTQRDSLVLEFPLFNSLLVLKRHDAENLKGYWLNLNKGVNYSIPCELNFGYTDRFPSQKLFLSTAQPSSFNGKWECFFEPGTSDEYKAVGVFTQQYTKIEGTFLTETGDYRFLEGNVLEDSLYLSCFDGSHAFLFTGRVSQNGIDGKFYSGKHWETSWTAVRNETFSLTHPDSLTRLVDTARVKFSFKDINGNDFHFPTEAYENKVTIIQIMGTWCPNCMDETKFYADLYAKYHSKGLEIISIGYEIGADYLAQAASIERLKNRLNIAYPLLVGGSANKNLASKHFSMLNQIISFPTSILIGKDGLVRNIHTGFNGPGTGKYYEDYARETAIFIEKLLKE
jgi:thiol-disulfide isomerase/thioredoxin